MGKVVLTVVVLVQLSLLGCGNKDKNVGMPPQACGAGVPSQFCIPTPNNNNSYGVSPYNGPQGYGYYLKKNFYVPDYQNVQTGCDPGTQPFSSDSSMTCLQTSQLQQLGQPMNQQNYRWPQNQRPQNQTGTPPGPGLTCSPQDANSCPSGGFCQPLMSAPAEGYCRAT
jgi:hypothetical protein